MKPEPKKKLPNKKVISSAKFEAKEQFTKSALENLKTENERLVNSLKKSGEIKESKKNKFIWKSRNISIRFSSKWQYTIWSQ